MDKMTGFSKRVILVVLKIPRGRVATYGQIAKLAGKARSARGVGWLLHSCSERYRLPWHRVLNSMGRISFPWGTVRHLQQKKRLVEEGVVFNESQKINLTRYQWKPIGRPLKGGHSEKQIHTR